MMLIFAGISMIETQNIKSELDFGNKKNKLK